MVDPVQSVGVATALTRRYCALAQTAEQEDVELVIGEARQIYPEMWRHLDEARISLGERGTDCTVYDDLRRHELQSQGVDVEINVTEYYTRYGAKIYESYTKTAAFDLEGAHRAYAAATILKQLMPEVDWAARAREQDQLIREVGSLTSARWIGMAKVVGAGVAIALLALVAFLVLSNASPEDDAPAPRAHVHTPAKVVGLPDPVKLSARASCEKMRDFIAERVAKEQGLVRDPQWWMNCQGILVDNQAVAFAVSVRARSKGDSLVELRGVTSLDGMQDLQPFVATPPGMTLAFVGDLDRDTSDELVFVGQASIIVTKITKAGFVDIAGPPLPAGCVADAKVGGDYRNERRGEREDLILTVPEGQTGSNCLSPGKHYFWLDGDHIQES